MGNNYKFNLELVVAAVCLKIQRAVFIYYLAMKDTCYLICVKTHYKVLPLPFIMETYFAYIAKLMNTSCWTSLTACSLPLLLWLTTALCIFNMTHTHSKDSSENFRGASKVCGKKYPAHPSQPLPASAQIHVGGGQGGEHGKFDGHVTSPRDHSLPQAIIIESDMAVHGSEKQFKT